MGRTTICHTISSYLFVRAAGAAEVDDLDVGPLRVLQKDILRLQVAVDNVHLKKDDKAISSTCGNPCQQDPLQI